MLPVRAPFRLPVMLTLLGLFVVLSGALGTLLPGQPSALAEVSGRARAEALAAGARTDMQVQTDMQAQDVQATDIPSSKRSSSPPAFSQPRGPWLLEEAERRARIARADMPKAEGAQAPLAEPDDTLAVSGLFLPLPCAGHGHHGEVAEAFSTPGRPQGLPQPRAPPRFA